MSIKAFLQATSMSENFFLPRSTQAPQQFLELQDTTQFLQITTQGDRWTYPWGTSFSSIKMYKELTKSELAAPLFKHLWKNAAMLRYKIFLWLLLHDRVNTRNMRRRRTFHLPSYNCALCQMNTKETSQHLFWDCDFAFNCWQSILGTRCRGFTIFDEILLAIQTLPTSIAMEIMIMGCWNIWIQRNGNIFKGKEATIQAWKSSLKADLLLLLHRVKSKFRDQFSSWIEHDLN